MTARGSVAMLVVSAIVRATALEAEEEARSRAVRGFALSAEEEAASRPLLRLAWLDVAGLPRGVGAIAREEACSVMDQMGLEPRWRRARAAEPARPGEIQVLLVDRLLVDPETRRPILGATVADGRAHPVVWVHLAGVRATLGHRPRSPEATISLLERRDLGVALGRVVAHEVVHVVAPALAHGEGLMSRALTRHALTSSRISFEPGVAVVVRASLRGAPPSLAAPPGILTASGAIGEGRKPAAVEATGIADTRIRDAGIRDEEDHGDEGLRR